MGPKDLNKFLSVIDATGELARVKSPVDPVLETAAIINRVCKSENGGKTLLFENVKGSSIRVVANLFGSPQRMASCFGIDDVSLLSNQLSEGLAKTDRISSADALKEITEQPSVQPIIEENPPWQELDCTADGLDVIPALKSWPEDGGSYLTLAQVFTTHPDTGESNCGMYRVQLIDKHRALLRCHPGSGGADHMKAWHDQNEAMPVAITLGGPPALTWASGVSLPHDVREECFVGYLMGEAVAMSRCKTSGLFVPTNAEIVIEGKIAPGETLLEGPFGNHTGYYSPSSAAPVIKIESVSMRTEALYPCTVVGPPPMENVYMAQTSQRLLLPLLQYDCPWVRNVSMPMESIYHRLALVSVGSDCELELEQMKEALETSMLLKGSKLILMIDEDVDTLDQQQIYWRLINGLGQVKDSQGVVVDARAIPGSHKVLQADKIVKIINDRWAEYDL